MKPTIGILITYYNEKELLTECLDSVFSQTVAPDEVMVYDDFSEFKAEDYIPKGYKVTVIRGSENKGPGYGRNHLFKESGCEYVHFHDADDLFYPDWCQKVRHAIETTGAEVIFTEIASFKGNKLADANILGLEDLAGGADLTRFAISRSILIPSTTIRRDIPVKISGFRTREILPQSEDYDFHIRIAACKPTHAEILEPLIIQRVRSGSNSGKDLIKAWSSAVDAIRMLTNELDTTYRQDLAEAAAKAGSKLYSLKAHDKAKKAFELAQELGPPKFIYRSRLFYLTAKVLGPQAAEGIGDSYRILLSNFLRKTI